MLGQTPGAAARHTTSAARRGSPARLRRLAILSVAGILAVSLLVRWPAGDAAGAALTPASALGATYTTVVASRQTVRLEGVWSTVADARLIGGRALASHRPGAVLRFTFTGSGISLIGPKSPRGGSAQVFLDGRSHGTISTYTSSERAQATLLDVDFAAEGTHTISVRVTSPRTRWLVVNALVVSTRARTPSPQPTPEDPTLAPSASPQPDPSWAPDTAAEPEPSAPDDTGAAEPPDPTPAGSPPAPAAAATAPVPAPTSPPTAAPTPAPTARPASPPTAAPTPPPTAAPTPRPTAAPPGRPAGAVFGSGFAMDTLANMQVGGPASGSPNTYVAYRFRAATTASLSSVRVYLLDQRYSGYGGGTGGSLRIDLVPETGGTPAAAVLGSVSVPRPSGTDFPVFTFSPAVPVTAGTVYDLVFTNTDPRPTANFVSLDLAYVYVGTTPRQPGTPDADFGALRRFGGGAWSVQAGYTPIVDLAYTDGTHQGNGYMEVELGNPVSIGGGRTARERFTPQAPVSVSSAAVRIARTSGSGSLTLWLDDASGRPIDSCTTDASSVPVATASADRTAGSWVSCAFGSSHRLSAGTGYALRATATNSLWSRGIQQGDSYGFAPATYFSAGLLEVSANGGSSWSTVGGLGTSGDLQFYLAP